MAIVRMWHVIPGQKWTRRISCRLEKGHGLRHVVRGRDFYVEWDA